MDITNVDKGFIDRKQEAIRKRNSGPSFDNESFNIGWKTAIRLARQISNSEGICEQCGNLIKPGTARIDKGGCWFCEKCYEKLFENLN